MRTAVRQKGQRLITWTTTHLQLQQQQARRMWGQGPEGRQVAAAPASHQAAGAQSRQGQDSNFRAPVPEHR